MRKPIRTGEDHHAVALLLPPARWCLPSRLVHASRGPPPVTESRLLMMWEVKQSAYLHSRVITIDAEHDIIRPDVSRKPPKPEKWMNASATGPAAIPRIAAKNLLPRRPLTSSWSPVAIFFSIPIPRQLIIAYDCHEGSCLPRNASCLHSRQACKTADIHEINSNASSNAFSRPLRQREVMSVVQPASHGISTQRPACRLNRRRWGPPSFNDSSYGRHR